MPTREEVLAANRRVWGYHATHEGPALGSHDELRRARRFRRERAALVRAGLIDYPTLTPEQLAELDTFDAAEQARAESRVPVEPSWRARWHTRRRPRRVRNRRIVGPMEVV